MKEFKFAFLMKMNGKSASILYMKSELKRHLWEGFSSAVAFVLQVMKTSVFEGEPAMWLEKISWEKFPTDFRSFTIEDYLENDEFENIPTKLFLKFWKKKSGKAQEIGLNFHYTLIKAIEKIAQRFCGEKLLFWWSNKMLCW